MVFWLTHAAQAQTFPDSYIQRQQRDAERGLLVDTKELAEGKMISVMYVGREVYVYRRTSADIEFLKAVPTRTIAEGKRAAYEAIIRSEYSASTSEVWARLLLDSESLSESLMRSHGPSLLVVVGWSPANGCTLRPTRAGDGAAPNAVLRDPCSGLSFDASGRVLPGFPSVGDRLGNPVLAIPIPAHHINGAMVYLGPRDGKLSAKLPFQKSDLYGTGSPRQKLLDAAQYNDIAAARQAIAAGAEVNENRGKGGSALDAAITGGSLDLVKLLISHGARPTQFSVMLAKSMGRDEVAELLR